MPYETDERLKSYLDSNQLQREQLCAAVLSIDGRFDAVTPQQPRGGPDGGGDIAARYDSAHPTIGAVGFINQATDSAANRRQIAAKFASDLASALAKLPSTQAFVFFTNVSLTAKAKSTLSQSGLTHGLRLCEVFDRERIRLLLDGPDGLSLRFQYLGLPLSEAEQAAFFSKWGKKIDEIVAQGFGETRRLLNRIQYFHEAARPLQELTFVLNFAPPLGQAALESLRLYARLLYGGEPIANSAFGYQFSYEGGPRGQHRSNIRRLNRAVGDNRGVLYYNDPEVTDRYDFDTTLISSGGGDAYPRDGRTVSLGGPVGWRGCDGEMTMRRLDGAGVHFFMTKEVALRLSQIEVFSDIYKLDIWGPNFLGKGFHIEKYLGGFKTYDGNEATPMEPELMRVGLYYHPFYLDFSRKTPVRLSTPQDVDIEQSD